ncbi:MAG: cytochrome c [Gammaproteobacteria bacterium]|nr:cytochrome c [Gammaproteobacteria bacterium]
MRRVLLVLAGAAAAAAAADAPEYGSDAYAACAACHLPAGEGVPGAFPPLRNRAAKIAAIAGGREYLISVVSSGLMGAMEADGMTYMGVMPGHQGSMTSEQIAAALNYVVFALSDEDAAAITPFSAEEVAAQQVAVKSPSPATAAGIRSKLVEQHANEWPR